MNVKKIAAAAALALVILGCVFAAGCTDSGTAPVAGGNDAVVGTWELDMDSMVELVKDMQIAFGMSESEIDVAALREAIPAVTYRFNAGGTGTFSVLGADTSMTWKSLGDNQYAFTEAGIDYKLSYDPATDTLADETGMLILVRTA